MFKLFITGRYLLSSVAGVFIVAVFLIYSAAAKSDPGDYLKIERGQILSVEHGCVFCHSPKVVKGDDLIPDPDRLFSGHPSDNKLPDIPEGILGTDRWFGLYTTEFTAWGGPWGISYASNLTPDKTTGIGNWSEDDFITVLRVGIHSSFMRKLMPPMPWNEMYQLSDDDLGAIFKYLRTVKPVENKVPDSKPLIPDENLASHVR